MTYKLYMPSDKIKNKPKQYSLYTHSSIRRYFCAVPSTHSSDQHYTDHRINALYSVAIHIGIVTFIYVRLCICGLFRINNQNMSIAAMYSILIGTILNTAVPRGYTLLKPLALSLLMVIIYFGSLFLGCLYSGLFYSSRLQIPNYTFATIEDVVKNNLSIALPKGLNDNLDFKNWIGDKLGKR